MAAENLPHPPPEDLAAFRVAQLLLVLVGVEKAVTLERLGYYDFFLANPMLIDDLSDSDRTSLVMAGFDSRTIDHQSASQRFANRRQRLRADVGTLVAYGLAQPAVSDGAIEYGPTDRGAQAAEEFTARYADGIRQAIGVVFPRLRRLSDRRLRDAGRRWLRAERFDLDLLGLEAVPSEVRS